jgi:ABC-type branched-subunit amino acid transport system ATPase component/ABC-type branched-subunit amino acid transport system permease subunit
VLAFSVGGWSISIQTLVIGALTGLTYAVLATGLVLVYRATRVINFAHGAIGAFGAALLAKLVLDENWNYWVTFVMVLALGGAIGGLVELTVVRRLFRAPRLVLLVATIGVSELLLVAQLLLPAPHKPAPYPSPLHRQLRIGTLLLTSQHFMVLAFVPVTVLLVAYLMNRTPYGLAIRAAADHPDRAELVGISTKRVSTLVWVLAGVLATLAAVLIDPIRNVNVGAPSAAVGPSLMLRALTAGLVGRLTSLPRALLGGLIVGIVEAIVFANVANPGAADAVLFVGVLVLVAAYGSSVPDHDRAWALGPKVRAIPERLRRVWWIDQAPRLTMLTGLVGAALLPLVVTSASHAYLFSVVLVYALVGLSVTVLTGWAGQLSLGQFAFVGLGAFVAGGLHLHGVAFGAAVAYAAVAGALVALLVGLPALRVPGLYLAITTLAFAVAAPGWLFPQHAFVGASTVATLPRGHLLWFGLSSQRSYYYMCLLLFALVAAGIARLRRSGIGRAIVAAKDNEAASASFGMSPAVAKLTAFALAGALAALAGALLAGLRIQFGPEQFGPELSLEVVAMTIIGGLGSVGGTILGALYVVGLPALFNNSATAGLLTSGAGLLALLLYLPGGLLGALYRVRDALLGLAERRLNLAAPATREQPTGRLPTRAELPPLSDGPALVVEEAQVTFGGHAALDGVSLEVRPEEIVGLIGANGAGKSTLLDFISGFVPGQGRVRLLGHDVGGVPAHQRARLGVGRVFQDARLFGDLTVLETIKVALEVRDPSDLLPSLLALPPSVRSERWKTEVAADYAEFLGLGRYADHLVSELSTGTRRILELCCLLAQGCRLLLLDEPTAGVAQREAEAFAVLIREIKEELGASVLIIEHDIPLVMAISDRVYCLALGRCIADGSPEQVRSDPLVVASYLGTDERAIARSGSTAGPNASKNGAKRPLRAGAPHGTTATKTATKTAKKTAKKTTTKTTT